MISMTRIATKEMSVEKQRPMYWITRKDQLRVMASAVRLDTIDRLAARGPMSVADLARATGKKATPIYHHLRQLRKVGLVRNTRESGTLGRPAAVYETVGAVVRMSRASPKPSNHAAVAKIGRIAAGQAAKDFARGFQSSHWRTRGAARNHWQFRSINSPSRERLAKINELFDELAALIWTPDPMPGKTPMSFAWFLAPLKDPPRRSSKASGKHTSSLVRR
jgi:predicted transcriptional regulator